MSDLQSGERTARPFEGSRLIGVFLLVIGVGVSYFEIVQPLQEAAQGARRVTWADNWSFMGLLLSLFGLAAAIFPKILSGRSIIFNNKGKLSIYGWLLFATLIAGAFALSALFHHQFAKLGYREVSTS